MGTFFAFVFGFTLALCGGFVVGVVAAFEAAEKEITDTGRLTWRNKIWALVRRID